MARFTEFIATFFYIGYAPVAPGTVGSFVALILWWFVPSNFVFIAGFLVVLFFFLGVWASTIVEQYSGIIDPSHIVIDEVVGIGVPLLFIPKDVMLYGIVFVVFRFFDITKVFPICLAERWVPKGWGIMLDDVIAGIMTLLIVYCGFQLQIL